MADAQGIKDPNQLGLIAGLTASLLGVGLWLMCLVGRAVYRLGWKKVEYIYTEREKSFVGQLVGPAAWSLRICAAQ